MDCAILRVAFDGLAEAFSRHSIEDFVSFQKKYVDILFDETYSAKGFVSELTGLECQIVLEQLSKDMFSVVYKLVFGIRKGLLRLFASEYREVELTRVKFG